MTTDAPTTLPDNAGLADEIERRRLKFADTPFGEYEMLSDEEHAAVCAALRPSVWMDISTAPKGEIVLVYADGIVEVATKVDGRDADWWTYDIYELGPTPCEVRNPTHWMPLPTPPKAPTP